MATPCFIRFRGVKGEQWLVMPSSLVAIGFEHRKIAGNVTWLLLEENRRIELAAETPESVLRKIEQATNTMPLVFEGDAPVPIETLIPEQPAEELHA